MPKLYEIFGYRYDDNTLDAQLHRQKAWCPFMDAPCDGGGNRWLTQINLDKKEHSQLKMLYPSHDKLMPGVCSIQPNPNDMPWIICPNRLLAFSPKTQKVVHHILSYFNLSPSSILGVWSEVKIEHKETINGSVSQFDYTFDYVLFPVQTVSLEKGFEILYGAKPQTTSKLQTFGKLSEKKGFVVHDNQIINFPIPKPIIIEVMTSSTSGQNKEKRTQIHQAFEDAILGRSHQAPSINYRQVWSRMVGQLFVKSEVALGWGGKTIWVLQDVLAKYISTTTLLNLDYFKSSQLNDINILSLSYPTDESKEPSHLTNPQLYSGKINSSESQEHSLFDIVRSPLQPPIEKLMQIIISKGQTSTIIEA